MNPNKEYMHGWVYKQSFVSALCVHLKL